MENQQSNNSSTKDFFCLKGIKENKRKLSPREVILSLLRTRNWKQTQLARIVGISPQALNNYLRGYWGFPTSIKIKIAQAFQVDSAVIWDLEYSK